MTFFRNVHSSAFCWILLLSLGLGCVDKQDRMKQRLLDTQSDDQTRNNVSEAIGYLPLLMRMDRSVAVKEVVFQLNSWAQKREVRSGWSTGGLLESLPADFKTAPLIQTIDKMQFGEQECEYLLQCRLMNQVSDWVVNADYRDELFAGWLAETTAKMNDRDRRDLEATMKLFDWTIRNIELLADPRDAETLTAEPQLPYLDGGPIYSQLPWQTMIFGRGDAWQRIRVFTQLLQQVELTACVLAIPDPDIPNELKLWAVGVPIGDAVYLFEPKWGLPILGPGEKGVATLAQAKLDRTVMRRANLPGQFEYPVSAEDLKNVVALLDLEPFAISKSTFALEPSLSGDQRMNIFVDVAPVIKKLQNAVGESNVKLWPVPILGQYYNQSVRDRLFDQSPFSMTYLVTYGPFFTDTLLNTARTNHLAGKFESTIDQNGALKNYMALRVDDATLDKLAYDKDVQNALQVSRGRNESLENFVQKVEQIKQFSKSSKYDVSAFLGMLQFDRGNFDAAIDWLDERTLQVVGTGAWHPQAEYLLARSYELNGDREQALQYLKKENRPQEAGNRMRARLLESSGK